MFCLAWTTIRIAHFKSPEVIFKLACTLLLFVLVANDPYHGGGHLPDYNVFAPVCRDGELVLIASIQCHHADTGGGAPGGYNVNAPDPASPAPAPAPSPEREISN